MPSTVAYSAVGQHSIVVPSGVTSITVDLYGAAGGGDNAGLGGRVQGAISVTPGETLYIHVGGWGGQGAGGYNGGGSAPSSAFGGGGGTDVRRGGNDLGHRVAVAGGGGGQNNGNVGGGHGGGLSGNGASGTAPGSGGTQSAGGAGGAADSGGAGTAGGSGSLGQGGNASFDTPGGGGGGGYYGGGGAGSADTFGSGGGGGSSLVPVGGSTQTGVRSQSGYAVLTYNQPPSAPSLAMPANSAALNPSQTQRFSWSFADPDPGDSQSAYELRVGIVGSGVWGYLSGTVNLPSNFHDVSAGSFGTGQSLEWQVRTADSQGVWGPWSASNFFTTTAAPAGPTVLSPVNGATLPTSSVTLSWSTSAQDAWQARVLNAGTLAVLQDSGTVENAATRQTTFTGLANGVGVRLEVRVRSAGLWSAWGAVEVAVSFTPPATPTVALAPDDSTGTIAVQSSHPTPSGGQPTVVSQEVWRRRTNEPTTELRIAKDYPPGSVFVDYTPASGVDYEYRVVAVGSSGATSESAWFSDAPDDLFAGGYLSGYDFGY